MNEHRQEAVLHIFVVCVVFLEGIRGNNVGTYESVYMGVGSYKHIYMHIHIYRMCAYIFVVYDIVNYVVYNI